MDILTNEEISNIRNSVDIVDIISKYIPLTQKGKNYFGVCPFHDDHSPSMSVSKEKQIYTCFTCGATGNVFKFIQDYQNISFREALKTVADYAGISVNIGKIQNKIVPNQELYDIYDISTKFYQNNINTVEGKKAKEYLHSRKIDDEIIKEFQIGLALKDDTMLVRLLTNKKYSKENMIKSGLVVKRDRGYTDIYYNRIMFPLYDTKGNIVGYSGRIYNGEKDSKYINTMETEIFKKGELLYNYHRAKDESRKKDQIIIVEGFMDVIRLYSVGIKNVVATMGTSVTKTQANLIKRMAKNIILCFDGDDAGAKATFSCSTELNSMGIIPKIIRLEEDLDPDDYIKKYGKERFEYKLNNPINVMDFKLMYLKKGKNFNNNIEKANYINSVIEELNKIDDDILKELTLQKISNESGIDIDLLKSKIKPVEKNIQNVEKKEKKKYTKYEKAQMYLIYYMLKSPSVIKAYDRKVTYIPTEKYRKLAYEISYYYKKNCSIDGINEADFITHLSSENEKLLNVLGEINRLGLKEEFTQDEIDDYINVINEFNLKKECNNLGKKIHNELSPIEKAKLLQRIIDLKKQD